MSPQEPLASSLGKSVGQAAAAVVLDYRSNDHSNDVGENAACTGRTNSLCKEPRFPAGMARLPALEFQPDDVSRASLKLGGIWGRVTLFEPSNSTILQKTAAGDHFLDIGGGVHLAPPSPGLPPSRTLLTAPLPATSRSSRERAGPCALRGLAVRRIRSRRRAGRGHQPAGRALGGTKLRDTYAEDADHPEPGGANDPTKQQFQASFWGYDGTALLCAPPRLYNMIAVSYPFEPAFVHQRISAVDDVTKMARYLALLNLALADAGIVSWNAKYSFNRARPIDYIRYGVPTKKVLIGGVETSGSQWTPLGQVASNFSAQNVTPPFRPTPRVMPSSEAPRSGSSGRSSTSTQPTTPPSTSSLTSTTAKTSARMGASFECPSRVQVPILCGVGERESRVWLGIHFQFDADDGTKVGNRIASNLVTEQLGAVAP